MVARLDERIARDLQHLHQTLEAADKIPSPLKLKQYYDTFREKFGPERLARLDGEALLETMHNFGRDSLVYWLEFKNDEEFPFIFGSISGGSAFKFGLFRRKETGIWTTGAPQKPVELSVAKAIERARLHRDQLIAGAELFVKMPLESKDDYQELEREIYRVAPIVSNLMWGHKYFSLLYPERLDNFHRYIYQTFHLTRLLQLYPGRYVAGWSFSSIAQSLNIPLNTLCSLLNSRDGSTPHSYWHIDVAKDQNKWAREYWPVMRYGNFCAIGWAGISDSSTMAKDAVDRQMLLTALQKHYPEMSLATLSRFAHQIFEFVHNIATGDLVLISDGATVLGIGRVIDDYKYNPSYEYPHHLPVEWLSLEEWQLPEHDFNTGGDIAFVHRIKNPAWLIAIERNILDASEVIDKIINEANLQQEPAPVKNLSVSAIATFRQTPVPPRLTGTPARIESILERKGQIILYGPPGTGKTYWAEYTARELAARASFQKAFGEQLTPEEEKVILGDDGAHKSGRVRVCSFHPSYSYEDFIEGLRPDVRNGSMHFVPQQGIFKRLCLDAAAAPHEKFYLIIDEINRGDIPRIFGELLTMLEKDKRGKVVLLPLTKEPFQVPKNVYLIGTMNTADRSIALLDTALRRRFGFIELMPDTEPLKNTLVGGIALDAWLGALNKSIREYIGREARNLQIGHAYLMENGEPLSDFATFARVVHEDILPLLEEYCYADYDRLEQIMGAGLIDAKAQMIRHELFNPAQEETLVPALIAPWPDIATSAQTIAAELRAQQRQAEEEEDIEDMTGGDE